MGINILHCHAIIQKYPSVSYCRYFSITCPFLDFIRQTKGSVLVCLLVWSVCIITASLAIALQVLLRFVIHALLPAPLFIFSIAGTTKALPAATSVCAEEKRRVVATLIVLLFKYSLLNLPAVTLLAVSVPPNCRVSDTADIILFVLIPFVDLFLFFLMRRGPIDRLLAYLCCCSIDNSAADVSNKSSVWMMCVHVYGQRKEGRKKIGSKSWRCWEIIKLRKPHSLINIVVM